MADRWMKFYLREWLLKTRGMTLSERGVFITLIAAMLYREGPLAEGGRSLARLVGTGEPTFRKILKSLMANGEVVETDAGLWCPVIDKWGVRTGREAIPKSVKDAVYDRDGRECVYCGDVDGPFHLDHVFPLSSGGATSVDNLVVACRPCNLSKGAKTLEEWMQ